MRSVAAMETVEGQSRIEYLKFVDEGEEDRISAMPDCVLIEILSRLPSTEEAIRTGTLSKRWNHLWPWVTTLIFTKSHGPLTPCRPNPNLTSDFVSFVDKTLIQCRQLKLKKFKVRTSYHVLSNEIRFELQYKDWIRYAVSCNVEDLNLQFWCGAEPAFPLEQFFFISSSFTDLTLKGCILNPSGAISWRNLRSLCLSRVKTEEDLIENMLSGSPLLETLVLEYSYGYRLLNVTSKSVKKLVFSGYLDPEHQYYLDDIIKINAPNILSLSIRDNLLLWKLMLVNVSSLVEANLDYRMAGYRETTHEVAEEEMLRGLIVSLRHAKELKVGGYCLKSLSRLEAKGFVSPSNIKIPAVTPDLSD